MGLFWGCLRVWIDFFYFSDLGVGCIVWCCLCMFFVCFWLFWFFLFLLVMPFFSMIWKGEWFLLV